MYINREMMITVKKEMLEIILEKHISAPFELDYDQETDVLQVWIDDESLDDSERLSLENLGIYLDDMPPCKVAEKLLCKAFNTTDVSCSIAPYSKSVNALCQQLNSDVRDETYLIFLPLVAGIKAEGMIDQIQMVDDITANLFEATIENKSKTLKTSSAVVNQLENIEKNIKKIKGLFS